MTQRPGNLPIDAIQKNRPLDGVEQSFRVDSPLRVQNRSVDIALATGAPVSEIADKVAYGDNSPVLQAKSSVGDVVGNTIASSLEQGIPPETAAVLVSDAQQKTSDMAQFSDFVLEGALTAGDPNFNPALARLTVNQQIAFEVMQERFEAANADKGTTGVVLDFIDRYFLRQIPIGMVEDLRGEGRTQRKGLELAQAGASMNSDEYREYITAYADELAEEGIFRGDNWFALQQGLQEASNAGYDPTARLLEALSIFDITAVAGVLGKGGRVLGRVASLRGVKAADEAVEALVKSGARDLPEIADELLPAHLQVSKVDDIPLPTQGRTQLIFQNNKLVKDIQELYRVGSFGRTASKEQIASVAARTQKTLADISSRPLARTEVVDKTGLGDQTLVLSYGKIADGTPFKNMANADKATATLKSKGLSATTVPVDPTDLKMGYYTKVEQKLDLTKVAEPINVDGAFTHANNGVIRALASAASTDDIRLTTLANLGESGNAAISELVQPYLKQLAKLPYQSKQGIDAVYRNLRDGADSFLREAYTETDFKTKFKQLTGKNATQADLDAYYALQTINDAAYVLQANKLVTRYVNRGFKSIDLGNASTPAKKFDGVVAGDTQVWDASISRLVNRSELNPEEALWKVDRPLDGHVDYVSRPKTVRGLEYEDVLPYNAGGRRTNAEANYFVTSGDGRGRALFTAYSDKQARKGATQLEAIFDVARRSGRNLDELSAQLDEVIKRNNDWNPSVENTADFVALAKKKGWDVNEKVSYKARDGVVEAADDVFDGMTFGEYTMSAKKRQDDVLMEFGGADVMNQSPIEAITAQMSGASTQYAMQAYTYNAKAAWLKKALRVSDLGKDVDVESLFRSTEVNGSGKLDRQLQSLKNIINRREGVSDELTLGLQNFGRDLSEYVFDKTGKKVPTGGVEGALLNFGFQSAFGFANVSQFLLQSTHAFAIMAISPKAGLQGSSLMLPLRLAMNSPDPALALKRLAEARGMSVKEMEDIATYVRTSGRRNIEADAIERGVGAGFGLNSAKSRAGDMAQGAWKQVQDKGIIFFNEGEKFSRQTGILTAIMERRAKFGPDILSDDARAWITRREQDLTFNMTTTNRGKWQTGAMKVPTQWLSYSMRSMEAVAIGRGLTGAERARLGFFMLGSGGMAGTVVGDRFFNVSDTLGETWGLDPEGIGYTTLKYGMFDGIISTMMSEISGEDVRTAFGTRIAPLTAFSDMYDKITEGSFLEAAGGPSGEMAASFGSALLGVAGNLYNGRPQHSVEDLMRVLRQPSGVDNIVKAIGIANSGMYRSKTGTTIPIEMGGMDALMQAAGITNFKVAEFYNRRTRAFRESTQLRDATKEVQNDFRLAIATMRDDQPAGLALMREISAKIDLSGFSPSDKMKLRSALRTDTTNDVMMLSLELLRKENSYGARVVEGLNNQ